MDRRTFTKTSLLGLLGLGLSARAGLPSAFAAEGICTRPEFRVEARATDGEIMAHIFVRNPGDFPLQYTTDGGFGFAEGMTASLDDGSRVTELALQDPLGALARAGARIPPIEPLEVVQPGTERLLVQVMGPYDRAAVASGPATLRLALRVQFSPAFSGRLPEYEACPVALEARVEIPT